MVKMRREINVKLLTPFVLKRKAFRESKKSGVVQKQMGSILHLKPTSLSDLKDYKRSDVLFILGSGASICSLDATQWEQVRRFDSLGMNFWTIHPHVPNFYSFELPGIEALDRAFLCNLKNRASDYQQTALISKVRATCDMNVLHGISDVITSAELSATIPAYFTVHDKAQLICLLQNYEKISGHLRSKYPDVLFRKRASVVFATMLGYDLGFKDIVYCGIDGKAGSGYFYETSRSDIIACGAEIPQSSGQAAGQVHLTMDNTLDPLTADVCLRLMNEHLFQRKRVRMWVGTQNSMLSEWMPSWKW